MYTEHFHKEVSASGVKSAKKENNAVKQEIKVLGIFKAEARPLARWEVYEIYMKQYGLVKEHSIVRAISNLLNGTKTTAQQIKPFDKVMGNAGATVNRWVLIPMNPVQLSIF